MAKVERSVVVLSLTNARLQVMCSSPEGVDVASGGTTASVWARTFRRVVLYLTLRIIVVFGVSESIPGLRVCPNGHYFVQYVTEIVLLQPLEFVKSNPRDHLKSKDMYVTSGILRPETERRASRCCIEGKFEVIEHDSHWTRPS